MRSSRHLVPGPASVRSPACRPPLVSTGSNAEFFSLKPFSLVVGERTSGLCRTTPTHRPLSKPHPQPKTPRPLHLSPEKYQKAIASFARLACLIPLTFLESRPLLFLLTLPFLATDAATSPTESRSSTIRGKPRISPIILAPSPSCIFQFALLASSFGSSTTGIIEPGAPGFWDLDQGPTPRRNFFSVLALLVVRFLRAHSFQAAKWGSSPCSANIPLLLFPGHHRSVDVGPISIIQPASGKVSATRANPESR